MSNRFLVEQFDIWRSGGQELVLVTVLETAGSTYSKAGRQLLINGDRQYAGLVGGGCLEGDLVLRAEEVLKSGTPQLVRYDMRDDADDLWGMGLGCRGMMRLLLQRLNAANDWQPFSQLAELMRRDTATGVELVIASDNACHPVGRMDFSEVADKPFAPGITATETTDGNYESLRWIIKPWPRVLLLGAGPDSHPVIGMARLLGWHITVADHRASLLKAPELSAADHVLLVDSGTLQNELTLESYSAACVMSHHLETDLGYLKALRECPLMYTGVLGPAARRAELLDRLKAENTAVDCVEFAARLKGPVGLDIGAETPQGIALALLAEMHATFAAAGVISI